MLKVEILYFDGCPTHAEVKKLIEEVLQEENALAEVVITNIANEEEAKKRCFLGSPTIRVECQDVEREARNASDFGRKCRIYNIDGKIKGLPSKEMIRSTIREVMEGGRFEKGSTCCS